MSYSFPTDVQQSISRRMATGGYSTEDDVLRDALRALTKEEEDLAAVREAVAEYRPGDPGLPLDEALDLVRRHPHDGDAPVEERLQRFDDATLRQQERQAGKPQVVTNQDRGWIREDLYDRGRAG